MVLGVEHRVPQTGFLQLLAEGLAAFHAGRAHQHRLTLGMQQLDLFHDGFGLPGPGGVDDVRKILTDHGLVRGNDHHIELVGAMELRGFGLSGARHARELLVHAEEVLEGDRGQGLVLGVHLHALLGLNGLVQAIGPAATGHEAARELIHDDHFEALAILLGAHHVIHIPLVHVAGQQGLAEAVQRLDVGGIVEVRNAEQLFGPADAVIREHDLPVLLFNLEILLYREAGDDGVDPIVLGGVLFGGARDDEGRASLVDEDGVHLVHDGVRKTPLGEVRQVPLHVVAQVVEAQLVVGGVGDVAAIGVAPLLVIQPVLDDADGEPQPGEEAAHPLRVTAG